MPPPAASPRRSQTTWWLVTAVIAGAIVMGLEMVAFRLYAPYFGYSIYVWGNMISIVMIALAVGYTFGGRLADRSHTDVSMYVLILASAAYQLVIVLTVRSFLPWLARTGDLTGTVLATLIIFAPPMIMLASVGPFVIRLIARMGHVGATAGHVSALSTFGSVAGVLVTTFVLVPWIGTLATLKVACGATAVLGTAGLAVRKRAAIMALLPIVVLPAVPDTTWSEDTVWVSESAYNLVRVRRRGPVLWIVLNQDDGGRQTVRNEQTGLTGAYFDYFAVGPMLVPAKRLLVLGMGGGASIMSTRVVDPDIEIDAVEIDPEVVEAAVQFFGLRRDDPLLQIHTDDARPWLMRNENTYDLVHLDLYQGGPYVPFYLVTEEFFELVRGRMSDEALLMMNVVDVSREHYMLARVAATLGRVFPFVAVIKGTGDDPVLVLAFTQQQSIGSIRTRLTHETLKSVRARMAGEEGSPFLEALSARVAANTIEWVSPADAPIFTDDHAPIDGMIRRMMAEYRARSR